MGKMRRDIMICNHIRTCSVAGLKNSKCFATGPDVGIEAVGFHYAKSWYHKAEMQLGLETDPSEMLNEMIRTVRKGGIISDVGCAYSCTPLLP